jgi:DNA segregation ATPase FtsK/SpoIIIE, S-DNA-T family
MKKKEPHIYREVGAIAWFGLGLLTLLSLLSFDPSDLPYFLSHPNANPSNFIGSIGAYGSNAMLVLFGMGGYLVPALCFAACVALYFHSHPIWKWKLAWAALFLASASCLLHLQPWLGQSWSNYANVVGPGGFTGKIIDDGFLCALFGRVGAGIILIFVYVASIILLFELHPRQMFAQAAVWYQDWQERRAEARVGSDPLAKLTAQERSLEHQRRELEKEILRHGKLMPGGDGPKQRGPKVIDTSLPNPAKKPQASDPHIEIEIEHDPEEEIVVARQKTARKPEPQTVHDGASWEKMKSKPARIVARTCEDYKLPPLDKLHPNLPDKRPVTNTEELQANSNLLVETLRQFGIEVRAGDITKGATITRYEIYPAEGVRVDKIKGLERDIARTMKAEKIHILAPIPGKDSVGVEIANSNKVPIVLRDLFETSEWIKSDAKIPLAVGKDVYGHTLVADLAEMPHLLIAGTTGSGKSVSINCLLLSLLYRFGPDDLRLILVDPKQVELQVYNTIPHLVVPVVTDPKKVLMALRWVIQEMENRYKILAKVGLRNIGSFNARARNKTAKDQLELSAALPEIDDADEADDGSEEEGQVKVKVVVPRDDEIFIPDRLPFIVVIIDELADLMQTAPADVESAIARLTAKARAAGIHLIIATQTPRREVVTGVIKTNIPSRIAFQVPSALDSRVILDENGAENLLGKGDFLYLPPGSPKLVRGQGAYVSDDEVKAVVDFCAAQAEPVFSPDIHQKLSSHTGEEEDIDPEDMELLHKCFEVIRQEKRASTSMLQRRLRLGYNRAAWAMDHFERIGMLGPENGAKPREILVDLDTYELPAS